jgi:hypothetical protein
MAASSALGKVDTTIDVSDTDSGREYLVVIVCPLTLEVSESWIVLEDSIYLTGKWRLKATNSRVLYWDKDTWQVEVIDVRNNESFTRLVPFYDLDFVDSHFYVPKGVYDKFSFSVVFNC